MAIPMPAPTPAAAAPPLPSGISAVVSFMYCMVMACCPMVVAKRLASSGILTPSKTVSMIFSPILAASSLIISAILSVVSSTFLTTLKMSWFANSSITRSLINPRIYASMSADELTPLLPKNSITNSFGSSTL